MRVEILSIFPEIFAGFLQSSILAKAIASGCLHVSLLNIRQFAEPPHFSVDDAPYGGGAGMVMKPEPILRAIHDAKKRLPSAKVILLSPSGERFRHDIAVDLSREEQLILLCGRYEGIDQRVIDKAVDREISIGDYVLMGGEVPAMVLLEASLRFVKGVLGNESSLASESFSGGNACLLEAPQYTRPAVFEGAGVPEVLISGNHAKVEAWRREQALARTKERRPDLLPAKGSRDG